MDWLLKMIAHLPGPQFNRSPGPHGPARWECGPSPAGPVYRLASKFLFGERWRTSNPRRLPGEIQPGGRFVSNTEARVRGDRDTTGRIETEELLNIRLAGRRNRWPGGDEMRRATNLRIGLAVPISLLVACATAPVPEVSLLPGGVRKLTYEAQKFSVESPPANWEMTTEFPEVIVAWNSTSTKSSIQIFASPPSMVTDRTLVEVFISALKITLRDKYPGQGTISLAGEKEIAIGGRGFYQVVVDWDLSPVEGVRVTGKHVTYILRSKKFDYFLSLVAVLGYYEQDRLVLDEVAGSFSVLE